MIRHMRAHLMVALATCLVASTPAAAQEDEAFIRLMNDIDSTLNVASQAQTAGACTERNQALTRAEQQVARLIAISPGLGDYYLELITRERAHPCPWSPSEPSTPPEQIRPQPGPPPPEPRGDEQRAALRAAAYNAAEIQAVTDPIERAFDEAEAARLAGNCDGWEDGIWRARLLIDGPDDDGLSWNPPNNFMNLPAGLKADYRERLQAARERRCGRVSFNSVQIAGGFGESAIPPGNYGFVRDGAPGTAPDLPAEVGERRVPLLVIEAGAQFRGIGRFNLGYREGDAGNRTEIPQSTTGGARGYAHTDNAPSDSTGIGGNVPLSVDTDVRVWELDAGYRIPMAYIFGGGAAAGSGVSPYFGITAAWRDREHVGIVSITTPVIATQTLEQDVDELEIAALVGADAVVPVGTRARFTLGGEVGAYLYDFDLDSLETNVQNFGPVADRDFAIAIEDGESDVGLMGAFRAEFSIDISGGPVDGRTSRVELFAGGGGRFVSDRAQVVNPFSGDFVLSGGTTFLDTDDAFDWQVMAGLRVLWGEPREP